MQQEQRAPAPATSLPSTLWPPQAPWDGPNRWCPVARPLTLRSPVVQVLRPALVSPSASSRLAASEDQSSPPFVSTPDFPAGSPVPSAATYPRRGPGAVAGSWRRCGEPCGPSTPRCEAAQPLDESLASSCAPFPGLRRSRGCLETNPGASRKRNYSSGWNSGYRASKHPGRRPAGSGSVAGRREPPIYSRSHPPARRRTSWW